MAWQAGIRAITLFVENLDTSKRFYQEVFDLPVTFEDTDSVVFDFGNLLINLLKYEAVPELIGPAELEVRETAHRFEITVTVESVDRVAESLGHRGVKLLNGPIDRPWGLRTASFKDPDGHIWEIAREI